MTCDEVVESWLNIFFSMKCFHINGSSNDYRCCCCRRCSFQCYTCWTITNDVLLFDEHISNAQPKWISKWKWKVISTKGEIIHLIVNENQWYARHKRIHAAKCFFSFMACDGTFAYCLMEMNVQLLRLFVVYSSLHHTCRKKRNKLCVY